MIGTAGELGASFPSTAVSKYSLILYICAFKFYLFIFKSARSFPNAQTYNFVRV